MRKKHLFPTMRKRSYLEHITSEVCFLNETLDIETTKMYVIIKLITALIISSSIDHNHDDDPGNNSLICSKKNDDLNV